ncbi:MAG: RNA-binding S4 domain-containing protein [Syntrophomonadaceae bacterium]|nr:RNA-binding S4 domain-containing protein [Syntrophomonadaceae bacterium]
MRLDKFLKVSRIIKRRSVARDFADNERVMINGRIAKPSTEVKKGDRIVLQIGSRTSEFEVLDVRDNVPAAEAKSLYRVIE